jgi:hypothetical protein
MACILNPVPLPMAARDMERTNGFLVAIIGNGVAPNVPANLANALLRERFNEDRGANRIKKIHINYPSSFKPTQD